VVNTVEGAWKEDGKGESIWDRVSDTPGRIKHGATGGVAGDSYHRFKDDIALLKQLNLKSCRFSIAWPRSQPTGSGAANSRGLDYYQDLAAAERWHGFENLWFITTALYGHYPEGVLPPEHQAALLGYREGDDRIMRAPLDFMGLNYDSPWVVKHSTGPNSARDVGTEGQWATAPVHTRKTDHGWDIYPQGFYEILMRMRREVGPVPIGITKNGASDNTAPDAQGKIHDQPRIEYLRQHLQVLAQAINDGVPVRGYHCWSLMDNFEWAEGYSQRFGLTYVDFKNGQRRTVKDSGLWYANVAKTNQVTSV
jgi:beta-glucosidase